MKELETHALAEKLGLVPSTMWETTTACISESRGVDLAASSGLL